MNDQEFRRQLGEKIRLRIKQEGYTSQRQAAAAIRIDDKQLGDVLKGKHSPRIDTLLRIARGLNCSLKISLTRIRGIKG